MSFNVHDSYKDLSVEDLKLVSNVSRLPYSVCLMNLEYDLNIGNCIRSAHIFGAERVFIFGRRRYDHLHPSVQIGFTGCGVGS